MSTACIGFGQGNGVVGGNNDCIDTVATSNVVATSAGNSVVTITTAENVNTATTGDGVIATITSKSRYSAT